MLFTKNEIITGDIVMSRCDVILTTIEKKAFRSHNKMFIIDDIYDVIQRIDSFRKIPYVFVYLDHMQLFKQYILPNLSKKIILVVHNGDTEFNDSEMCNNKGNKKHKYMLKI